MLINDLKFQLFPFQTGGGENSGFLSGAGKEGNGKGDSPNGKNTTPPAHNLILEGRQMLTITGVTDVDHFDERTILLYTRLGELTIQGKGLHINEVSVESGEMSVEGEIYSLIYGDKDRRSGLSAIGKLFR